MPKKHKKGNPKEIRPKGPDMQSIMGIQSRINTRKKHVQVRRPR